MPPSCPVPPAAGQQFIPEGHAEYAGADSGGELTAVRGGHGALIEYLDQVVDHRSRQGLRYELGFLLGVVVAATACAGHDEVAAQAQWAADAPVGVLRALGAKPDPLTGTITAPSEATLRRALANVDPAELQRMSTEWTQALPHPGPWRSPATPSSPPRIGHTVCAETGQPLCGVRIDRPCRVRRVVEYQASVFHRG